MKFTGSLDQSGKTAATSGRLRFGFTDSAPSFPSRTRRPDTLGPAWLLQGGSESSARSARHTSHRHNITKELVQRSHQRRNRMPWKQARAKNSDVFTRPPHHRPLSHGLWQMILRHVQRCRARFYEMVGKDCLYSSNSAPFLCGCLPFTSWACIQHHPTTNSPILLQYFGVLWLALSFPWSFRPHIPSSPPAHQIAQAPMPLPKALDLSKEKSIEQLPQLQHSHGHRVASLR